MSEFLDSNSGDSTSRLRPLDESLQAIHRELGIPSNYSRSTRLHVQTTPTDLVSIGLDVFGRDQRLRASAASAWLSLQEGASSDNVCIQLVSAFRSVDYQVEVIQRLLAKGQTINDILTRVAAPGFSEHQSGYAVDLTTEGYEALEEEFEKSPAFRWLSSHAARYRFHLSYPRSNEFGVIYEPWHWCFREAG